MTTAERLINEGIEQGIEQGIEKGIRALMKLGIDSAGISAALEVPLSTVEAVIRRIRAEAK